MPISYNSAEIFETIHMIAEENLDIRTTTMGISLKDCISESTQKTCDKIYDKITRLAENLVPTGEAISKEYGFLSSTSVFLLHLFQSSVKHAQTVIMLQLQKHWIVQQKQLA